jgi:hypothetical protein
MNPLIHQLRQNKDVFRALLEGVSPEMYSWREQEGKWNLLEVVCHLYDEEREDFRTRLHSVLTDPSKPFPPIDPPGWVTERKYGSRHYGDMMIRFLDERDASVSWLLELDNPAWNNAYHHPKLGPMSGHFILANWVAHDYLHVRQVTRMKYNYLRFTSGQELSYAGDW